MEPYFLTHPVGVLYAVTLLAWYSLELRQFVRQRRWRQDAADADPQAYPGVFWAGALAAVIVLMTVPTSVPAAAIGHAATLFGVGMLLLVAGAGLRVWSFQTLGRYFTFGVKVSPDQPVVTGGPYRVLRHPGYAGGLLAIVGIGILYGNWISLAALVAIFGALTGWRIHVEERALLTVVGGSYGAYAAQHKRLVPLVW